MSIAGNFLAAAVPAALASLVQLPRPVVVGSLSADHRVSDGHRGGRFLARVEQLLQEPDRL